MCAIYAYTLLHWGGVWGVNVGASPMAVPNAFGIIQMAFAAFRFAPPVSVPPSSPTSPLVRPAPAVLSGPKSGSGSAPARRARAHGAHEFG